jgi:hypothetical protein
MVRVTVEKVLLILNIFYFNICLLYSSKNLLEHSQTLLWFQQIILSVFFRDALNC